MGAIVNRDLKQRVRPVNGLASHNTCVKQQIKLAGNFYSMMNSTLFDFTLFKSQSKYQIFKKTSDVYIFAAKIVQNFDKKWGLWEEEEEKKDQEKEFQSFGLVSNNPVLKNITDYLVEEGNYEEDELLGLHFLIHQLPRELFAQDYYYLWH